MKKFVVLLALLLLALPIDTQAQDDAESTPQPPTSQTGGILDSYRVIDQQWLTLMNLLESTSPIETKLAAIAEFRSIYSYKHKYSQKLDAIEQKLRQGTLTLDELKEKRETRSYITPDFYRQKTEWFSAGIGIGTLGGTFRMTLFTVRWEHFYIDFIRGNFTGGWGAIGGHGGMGIGIPFHFKKSDGRKEIRIGTGVEVGGYRFTYLISGSSKCYDDYDPYDDTGFQYSHCYDAFMNYAGPLPYLEILYSKKIRPRLGIEFGISGYFFIPALVTKWYGGDGVGLHRNIWVTPNIFAFFGVTI